jgi:hypothetical protein
MAEYLKGNYRVSVPIRDAEETPEQTDAEKEFYRRALERLGGSIAFVLKSKNLLWTGEQGDKDSNPN